jgi:Uma2 family endonuclease
MRRGHPLLLHLQPAVEMTAEQFHEFCLLNPDFRMERTARGDIQIMAPTGGIASAQNSEIIAQLTIWAKQAGNGVVFDSSGGFVLPSGAIRSPDAAWVRHARLAALTSQQKRGFLPLCPDFVVELCSPSDQLPGVQEKMAEYVASGAQLGWLIDPDRHCVHVYRADGAVEILNNPTRVSGDPVLLGFVLDLTPIWQPAF